jgi:hypothetical protein
LESNRNIDMKAEKQLASFLDEHFYSRLHDKNGISVKFDRKKDKTSQLQGIDVELNADGKTFIIDEKASFYYSNAMIPTFAFEINSLQKGHNEPVDGWFVNDSLKTEYYLLIWPNIKCEYKSQNEQWVRKNLDNIKQSDFTIVEAMLIERKRLLTEVEKYGCSKPSLIEYAKKLRTSMNNKIESKSEIINNNIKIMYSGNIAEKPINAVIHKKLLKSIASATYLISEDGYAQI